MRISPVFYSSLVSLGNIPKFSFSRAVNEATNKTDNLGRVGYKTPTWPRFFARRAADGLRRIHSGKSVTNRPQGAEEPRVRGSNRVSCWVRLQSPASDHELSSGPRRLSTHHRHHRHRSRGRAFLHGQVLQHQGDAILFRHGTRALAKEKGGD